MRSVTRELLPLLLAATSVVACAREAPPVPAETSAAVAPSAAVEAQPEDVPVVASAAGESASEPPTVDGGSLMRLAAAADTATALPNGRWKAGTNYIPIVPAQPTDATAGRVEVDEIFWYGCGHCYALDPFLEKWKQDKADYIDFVRIPVMWGPAHKSHARLYYTLEALKRTDLHGKAFDEIHVRGRPLLGQDDASTRKVHLEFLKSNGVSEADFNQAYDSFGVNTALQRAEQATRRYRVEGVPLMIVAGKYSTDVGLAGGHSQLLALLNDLAASEKRP